jgi:hypothetical protein
MFFYCAAKNSCKRMHMVGAINPNQTQTLNGQIEAAKVARVEYAPRSDPPREGEVEKQGNKLSTGVIVGIAVGGAAFLGICAALFFFMGRATELKEIVKRGDEGSMMNPVGFGRHAYFGALEHRQSAFSQSQGGYLQSPGGCPQDFGSPLPAYTSPRFSNIHADIEGGGHYR